MKLFKIHHPFDSSNSELIQEYYRERFYGGVTLIALNVTMLSSETLISPNRAFSTVIFTVLGLWGASILAAILSHRVTLQNGKKETVEIKKVFSTHWGIILSAVPILFFIVLSMVGFLTLFEALISAIIISFMRISITVIDALVKNDRHNMLNVLSFTLQIIMIGMVILFKFLSEK